MGKKSDLDVSGADEVNCLFQAVLGKPAASLAVYLLGARAGSSLLSVGDKTAGCALGLVGLFCTGSALLSKAVICLCVFPQTSAVGEGGP